MVRLEKIIQMDTNVLRIRAVFSMASYTLLAPVKVCWNYKLKNKYNERFLQANYNDGRTKKTKP